MPIQFIRFPNGNYVNPLHLSRITLEPTQDVNREMTRVYDTCDRLVFQKAGDHRAQLAQMIRTLTEE